MKNNSQRSALILVLWWLLLVVAAQRIAFPFEETRQLAVAWEMWRDQQWWVPQLNGAYYGDHPPLLYWLIHGGWWLFGVDETWPFLVPVLFQALSLVLAARIARLLWPQAGMGTTTVLLLSGLLLWPASSTALMFEFLLAGFTLLGILGLVLAHQGRSRWGWLLLGIALSGGLLGCGLRILVYLLPVALLAPWWSNQARSWPRWYLKLALTMGVSMAVVGLWLLVAMHHADSDYAALLIASQGLQPLQVLLAGQHPPWWFLPLLPLVFFPWLLWPTAWQALASLPHKDQGVRLIIAWLVPSVLWLSLYSQQQAQDLLPLLPAFSVLLARGLLLLPPRKERALLPALGVLIWAGALSSVPIVAAWHGGSDGLTQVHPAWGMVIALLALGLAFTQGHWQQRLLWLSSTSLMLVIIIHLAIVRSLTPAYDAQAIGTYLAELQSHNLPIAHLGRYNGQFHFSGRLPTHLDEVHSLQQLQQWNEQHPKGWVVAYYHDWPLPIDTPAPLQHAYRSGGLALWPAQALLAKPELQQRLRF